MSCACACIYLDGRSSSRVSRVCSLCEINVACPYTYLDGFLDALDPRLLVLGEGVAQRQARLCRNEVGTRWIREGLDFALQLAGNPGDFVQRRSERPEHAPPQAVPQAMASQPTPKLGANQSRPVEPCALAGRTGRVFRQRGSPCRP